MKAKQRDFLTRCIVELDSEGGNATFREDCRAMDNYLLNTSISISLLVC